MAHDVITALAADSVDLQSNRQDQIALDDRVADGISQEFVAQLGSNSSTVTIVVTEE